MRRIVISALLLVLVSVVLGATTASAAPVNNPHAAQLTLQCPSGTSSAVVILVRGEWTPAHVIGSNAVFIPIAFGRFTGVATDADGNILFTVDEPALAKGSALPQNGELMECTGVIELDFPGGHFIGSSTVTGFFANP
jgi:hypothetical protein